MQILESLANLENMKHDSDMLLIYFGSDTCGVCRDMLPKLEAMLTRYPGIQAAKIEPEVLPELAAHYQVFTIPAILLLIQGKVTIREAGIISLNRLEPRVERYYHLFTGIVKGGVMVTPNRFVNQHKERTIKYGLRGTEKWR